MVPDHEGTGMARREAHYIDALAKHFQVDVVAPQKVSDAGVAEAARGLYEAKPAPFGYGRLQLQLMQLRALLRLGPPRSMQVAMPLTRAIVEAVPDWDSYDVVCVDWPEVAPVVRQRSGNAWILTYPYLESRQAEQRAAAARRVGERLRARVSVLAMRPYERRTLDQFDSVFVTSPEDAELLEGRALLAPNGVDCENLQPSPVPQAPGLVMTGSLSWEPNMEGAAWFANEVLPLVRARQPEVTLAIVGFDPKPSVLALGELPGVSVHGNVPSAAPYIRAARVALVPLFVGSGTRLKALEAMALGRPVVGTSVGLEGLGITDGVEAAIANDAHTMAARIVQLLEDDALAGRIGLAGRQLAERSFCWSEASRLFIEKALELARRRSGQSEVQAAR